MTSCPLLFVSQHWIFLGRSGRFQGGGLTPWYSTKLDMLHAGIVNMRRSAALQTTAIHGNGCKVPPGTNGDASLTLLHPRAFARILTVEHGAIPQCA